jgi:hypothetical protein
MPYPLYPLGKRALDTHRLGDCGPQSCSGFWTLWRRDTDTEKPLVTLVALVLAGNQAPAVQPVACRYADGANSFIVLNAELNKNSQKAYT